MRGGQHGMLDSKWFKEGIHAGATYCKVLNLRVVKRQHETQEPKLSETGIHGGEDGRVVIYRLNEPIHKHIKDNRIQVPHWRKKGVTMWKEEKN